MNGAPPPTGAGMYEGHKIHWPYLKGLPISDEPSDPSSAYRGAAAPGTIVITVGCTPTLPLMPTQPRAPSSPVDEYAITLSGNACVAVPSSALLPPRFLCRRSMSVSVSFAS